MTSEPRYFFIIGAMKAGTTSLFNYLAGHPQLCPSAKKEPRVFRDPGDPARHRQALLALFHRRRDEPWCFEASTAYTKYPMFAGIPRRLEAVVPEARFIYLVRNPVDRVWSQYAHNLAHGRESRTFHQALIDDPQYLDTSRYCMQITQYLATFPRDRFLIQVFEEMAGDPAETVRAICEFLGVDTSYRPSTRAAYNQSSDKRRAPQTLRVAQAVGADSVIHWRLRRWLKAGGSLLPSKHDVLTPEVRTELATALKTDTEAFFEVLGRRIGEWPDFA